MSNLVNIQTHKKFPYNIFQQWHKDSDKIADIRKIACYSSFTTDLCNLFATYPTAVERNAKRWHQLVPIFLHAHREVVVATIDQRRPRLNVFCVRVSFLNQVVGQLKQQSDFLAVLLHMHQNIDMQPLLTNTRETLVLNVLLYDCGCYRLPEMAVMDLQCSHYWHLMTSVIITRTIQFN